MVPARPSPLRYAWLAALRALLAGLTLAMLAGCAATVERVPLDIPAALANLQSKTLGGVTVSAAILTDGQAQAHFGADLGARDVQAVWLSVHNDTQRRFWLVRNRLDRDLYSPDEVAQLAYATRPADEFEKHRQHLRDESIRVLLQPETVTEGFVFLPKAEGGRFLDVSLVADAWDEPTGARQPQELRFGLVVRLPDGEFDYERLDTARAYGGRVLPDLDGARLREALADLPCCTENAEGTKQGDPLNLVLVGEADEVLNALVRTGWSFTQRITAHTVMRVIDAALTGVAYPVAPVSDLYALGRRQDVAMQRARRSISQRNHLRLWLAPFRAEGRSVWIGQVSRDIGVKLTTLSPTLTTHVIDPDVDLTRTYLLHGFVAASLGERAGFAKGSAAATRDQPRLNLTDDPWFSDGLRLVVFVAREPVPVEAVRNLQWERPAAPVAEGQSEAAERNVRPLRGR